MDERRAIGRHYGLDWLRIGAFGLLILYHIGMYFAPGEWMIKSPVLVEAAVWPMLAVQPWRMPILFVVSGFATYALLNRVSGPATFALSRSLRLLLPLLFGILVLNPPQYWASLVAQHGYPRGLAHFWLIDWFGFRSFGGVPLPHEGHLWFIAYLWTYTMVLLLALAFLPATTKARLTNLFARLQPGWRLLWVPLVLLIPVRLVLLFTVPEEHGVFHDWVSDIIYVPALLFGFGLAGQPEYWSSIRRCVPAALVTASLSYAVLLGLAPAYPGDVLKPHLPQALDREAALVMGWSMILLLLALADRWLNREHRWRPILSEAVFPAYLVHHTIIVVTGAWLATSGLPTAASFFVLLAMTIAGCWLFYRLGGRIRWLRPLIGLRAERPTGPAAKPSGQVIHA